MLREEYNIEGMHCAACSSSIERVTRKLDGVEESNVNLLTKKLNIFYDENKVDSDTIIKKIEAAGFQATLSEGEELIIEDEKDNDKIKLIISLSLSFIILYISMGGMFLPSYMLPRFLREDNFFSYSLIQLILSLSVMAIGGHFYINGFKSLFNKVPNMDSLVAIGTSSAFIYSTVITILILSGKSVDHHIYFESAAVVVSLVSLGKYMEKRSTKKTLDAIKSLINIVPQRAHLFKNGEIIDVDTKSIKVDDIILIRPGEVIPLDGVVVFGNGSVDESMITGESIPIEKSIDSEVIGGSLNTNGSIQVKVKRVGKDTTISQIVKIMNEAQVNKAPVARLADKIAGVFVPVVMMIALLAFVIWFLAYGKFYFAINIFISIMVIACPCALGLATPTAIMVATGVGAKNGILIRSGAVLENVHLIDTVVFDKTGTVTEGRLRIDEIKLLDNKLSRDEGAANRMLALVASIENYSEHPIARAIVDEAKLRELTLMEIDDFSNMIGKGIAASIQGLKYMVGNKTLLKEYNISCPKNLDEDSRIRIFFFTEKNLLGVITLSDSIKEGSKVAISDLKSMKLRLILLTGDKKEVADIIAKEVGIDEVISEVLPVDKANEVAKLKDSGANVMMVGDGINDAPALVSSDIGIAMGSGSDIAIKSGDIVLMKSDLNDIVKLIKLSHATLRNIKENLFWAFFYNVLGIPIAAGVFYPHFHILLNPMIGAFAMSFSSVFVVANALRLRKVKL